MVDENGDKNMTFTEEDAQDDALIKKEAGASMAQVAPRTNARLYEAFVNVCEDNGRSPSIVLGDLLIRALNDESFSEIILNTDVDMSVVNSDSIRREDVELVQEFADMFNLNESNEKHPLESLVEERLKQSGGVTPGMMQRVSGARQQDSSREVRHLENRMDRIEGLLEEIATSETGQTENAVEEDKKDVDELFSGGVEAEDNEQERENPVFTTAEAEEVDEE